MQAAPILACVALVMAVALPTGADPIRQKTAEQGAAALRRAQTPKDAKTLLLTRLPEVRIGKDVGIADVVEYLRDVTGANLFVNWDAMEGTGVDRATKVSFALKDAPFEQVISVMLQSAAGDKLAFEGRDELILVSTSDDLAAVRAFRERVWPALEPRWREQLGRRLLVEEVDDTGGGRPSVRFDAEPLDRVVKLLSERTRVPIVVDWDGLGLLGIDRAGPTSLRLRNVTLEDAVTLALAHTRQLSNLEVVAADERLVIRPTREAAAAAAAARRRPAR